MLLNLLDEMVSLFTQFLQLRRGGCSACLFFGGARGGGARKCELLLAGTGNAGKHLNSVIPCSEDHKRQCIQSDIALLEDGGERRAQVEAERALLGQY